jgi:hypothetical protein
MSIRTQPSTGRGEVLLSRIVLIITTLALVALGYVSSGIESQLFLGLLFLGVVAGVVGLGRVRARARWEAAWDAYAAQEGSRDRIRPYQEQRTLAMAGSR